MAALVHDLRDIQYSNFIRGGMDFAAWYRLHESEAMPYGSAPSAQPVANLPLQTRKPLVAQGPSRKTAELARYPHF